MGMYTAVCTEIIGVNICLLHFGLFLYFIVYEWHNLKTAIQLVILQFVSYFQYALTTKDEYFAKSPERLVRTYYQVLSTTNPFCEMHARFIQLV